MKGGCRRIQLRQAEPNQPAQRAYPSEAACQQHPSSVQAEPGTPTLGAHPPSKSRMAGFALTLEALSALLLLLIALAALPLFSLPKSDAEAFFLCSDAAIVLSGAPSSESLGEMAQELGAVSGMKITAGGENTAAQKPSGARTYAFTVPRWENGRLHKITILCG